MYDKITPDQWLSLSEASAVLGVHASTLRRWADSGRVPCQRTPGGHRRFNRRKLLQMLDGGMGEGLREGEAGLTADLGWRDAYERAGLVEELRFVGQRLAGVAMQFLMRDDSDERYLAEARTLASQYATRSRQAGIGMLDAAQAFLYYRSAYIEMVGQIRGSEQSSPTRLLARYEHLMGQVLLAMLGEYEATA
jgi:excisionase family DNA binding protein